MGREEPPARSAPRLTGTHRSALDRSWLVTAWTVNPRHTVSASRLVGLVVAVDGRRALSSNAARTGLGCAAVAVALAQLSAVQCSVDGQRTESAGGTTALTHSHSSSTAGSGGREWSGVEGSEGASVEGEDSRSPPLCVVCVLGRLGGRGHRSRTSPVDTARAQRWTHGAHLPRSLVVTPHTRRDSRCAEVHNDEEHPNNLTVRSACRWYPLCCSSALRVYYPSPLRRLARRQPCGIAR